jgi:hypothetical protein
VEHLFITKRAFFIKKRTNCSARRCKRKPGRFGNVTFQFTTLQFLRVFGRVTEMNSYLLPKNIMCTLQNHLK